MTLANKEILHFSDIIHQLTKQKNYFKKINHKIFLFGTSCKGEKKSALHSKQPLNMKILINAIAAVKFHNINEI